MVVCCPGKGQSLRLFVRLEKPQRGLIHARNWPLGGVIHAVARPRKIELLEVVIMNITRFEPWALINTLHRDLDQIANRHYGLAESDHSVADWIPAVDVVEEKERFVIRADLPGVTAENIDINMENGVLSLSGERKHESADEIEGMKRYERVYGKFFRRFTLPDSADADAISARSANGILEISIPKQAQVQARRITVDAA
jgi:HSP20 family protein